MSIYKQEVLRLLEPSLRFHAFYKHIEPGILQQCGHSIAGDSCVSGNMLIWRDRATYRFKRNGAKAVWFPTQFATWLPMLPSVATIHDMAAFLAWGSFGAVARAYMPATLLATCRSAQTLMIVSESSASDLHRIFPWTRGKTVVARHGLPTDARHMSEQLGCGMHAKDGIQRLLFLDGSNPRKRLDYCLQYLEARGWHNIELTVTGQTIDCRRRILGLLGRMPDQIKLVGRLERHKLLETLSITDVLLYPSDFEGFGFPLIEAMAFGTTVVSFPGNAEKEVGGDCAVFAARHDLASLGRAIDMAMERARDHAWQQKLMRHARSFTWDESVRIHNEVLGNLIH